MKMKRRHGFLFLAGAALIAASLACSGAASGEPIAPAPQPTASISEPEVQPTGIGPSEGTQSTAAAPMPAIPERRRVSLEYPPTIRAGDSDVIRLTLEMDDLGGVTPTAEVEGNVITGKTVEIPNLYETHNVTAEARLDMAGVEMRPAELISSPLEPGGTVTFYWSVKPQSTGTFKGTAWLLLKFVNKRTGETSERAISAQTVEIRSTNFLGLSAGVARTSGAVGSLIGGIIGFPFFEDILKFVFRRARRK